MKKFLCEFLSLLVFMALLVGCGEDKKYEKALDALEQGNVETAKALFTELGDYEDAEQYVAKLTSTVEGVSDAAYYFTNELYLEISSDEYWNETVPDIISALETPEIRTLNDIHEMCTTLPEWKAFDNWLESAIPSNAAEEELALKNLMKQYWVSKCQVEINKRVTDGNLAVFIAMCRFLGGDESAEDEFLNSVVVIAQEYFENPDKTTLEIMNDDLLNEKIQTFSFLGNCLTAEA